MDLMDLRSRLVLVVLGLYLILNSGFMVIRVPVLQVPLGEVLLVLFFVTIMDTKWLNSFSRSMFLLPFLIFMGLGITRAAMGVGSYGVWALRDATHVVESLFIWIGFVCAAKPQFVDRVFNWFPKILMFASIYMLTFPFRDVLQPLSPTITSLAGVSSPIVFNYLNTSALVLVSAGYLLLYEKKIFGIPSIIVASFLLAFIIIMTQSRTVYLQSAALFIILVMYRRNLFKSILIMFSLMIVVGILILSFGVEITGRTGQTFSFDFVGAHFLSIFGIGSEGVGGAAAGSNMRLEWWGHIWRKMIADESSFFLGLGFGIPLTDFKINNLIIVREPHNSFFSVFARIGLIGLLAFLWMHFNLFRMWRRAYWRCVADNNREGQNRLLVMLIFFAMILVNAIGEDSLEKPFNAIPYYFFWGVILHYGLRMRDAAQPIAATTRTGKPA